MSNLDMVKHQVMANYLYQQQGNNGWRSDGETQPEGVVLRVARDRYITHPPQLAESNLLTAFKILNVQVRSDD